MLNFRVREGVLALAVIFTVTPLHASSPRFFQASTQSDFLKGEVENLSIDSRGQLVLGPATELVYETSAPFLWSMLAEPDGTILVGTGNEGKVFKIDPQGKGSLFFASPELEVHALARTANGTLYVASSPDGKIYRLDSSGAATEFFDPGDKYIWALAVDRAGNVYAGTGGKGLVYKITPDGKGAIFYRTNATHATALAFDAAGNLIVGTGSPGKILRVDQNAKGFVLLDSPYQEIHALRFDDKGLLYAAAVSGRQGGGLPSTVETSTNDRTADESSPTLTPSVSTEVTSVAVVDGSSGAPPTAPARDNQGRAGSRGAVYRIAPDGVWDQLWESRDDSPYDVTFDQSGALIIGTGNKGKIYRLEGDPPQPTLLARANAQQVTSFFKDASGRLYYATANPGKLFRLSSQRSTRGTYESEARDAQTVAAWGALNWRGTASASNRIELFTRSGNTGTPDDTWSPWSAAYTNADGSPITSPKARYLQWRAVLTGTGEGPILTSVRAAYLQRNLRPQVHSITVHPPGIVFQKAFPTGDPDLAGFDNQTTPERKMAAAAAAPQIASASSPVGRRSYQKGLQTLVWRADDENDDELVYDVLYRREGDVNWKVLRRDIPDSILVWDTTTVPNGTYFVKIVASDAPSNPAGTALTGELDSIAFEIDNTPPAILIKSARVEAGHTFVSFDVKDADSSVKRVEYSQDGLQWHSAFPVDGIADSREEHYELVLDGELGDHGLTLRAADALDNVATAHVDRPPR